MCSSPRDLATWDGDYPMLVVTAPQEDGQGWGASVRRSSMSQRRCVFWGAYSGPLKNDLAAAKLYEDLEALRIRSRAIINHPTIMGLLQRIHSSGQRSMRPPVRTLVFIKVKWLSILAWSFPRAR